MDKLDNKQENVTKIKIISTDKGTQNGQMKCPKCGSTDISQNINTSKLRCNFCRYEFEVEKDTSMETDVKKLKGKIIGLGAKDIIEDAPSVITLKCESCGAEVVIDTDSATNARCHWCRNILSINKKIPNGAVPDVLLPFSVKKDVAKKEIEKFVGSRKFFAHPKFIKEFTTENIMGVYFPYMLIDVNGHALFKGEGEHQVRQYTVGSGNHRKTKYDADLYRVGRKFDITIKELSIEASSDKLNKSSREKTNNIINSIMPFDTENCVKWNANYLRGYTSEKRDINVDNLENIVMSQAKDIAKFKINDTIKKYDRGVSWKQKDLNVEGEQWKAAYLPVWLYSYQQKKGDKSLLHYIAVNARTKETMGSIPLHMPKLFIISLIVEIIGMFMMMRIDFGEESNIEWFFLLPGILFFVVMYIRYRNAGARHHYETETVSNISNLVMEDEFIMHRIGLRKPVMEGANNTSLEGETLSSPYKDIINNIKIDSNILDILGEDSKEIDFVKDNIDKF